MKIFCFLILTLLSSFAKLTVASVNPIATDLLRQIGGDKIEIVEIVRPGMDVHAFQPHSKDIRKLEDCQAIFAMGKGLEPYLAKISDALGPQTAIVELGRTLPSLKIDADPVYACCPAHSRGAIDPYWWHNVKNMARVTKVVAKALSTLDGNHKEFYKANANVARKQYRDLHNWVKGQISMIPKKNRILVTAHVAFAYFCKEYGFEAAYVQGLSKEGNISTQTLAKTVEDLKRKELKAVFPEQMANPKVLKQIAKATGAKVGAPLYADHIKTTYKDMVFYNIKAITSALR